MHVKDQIIRLFYSHYFWYKIRKQGTMKHNVARTLVFVHWGSRKYSSILVGGGFRY